MNKLSVLTYTHTNTKDLHAAYFGRLYKYFPQLKNSYVLCNEPVEYDNCIVYDDSTSHGTQMSLALKQIPTEYVIYSQEDYILFDYVTTKELESLITILDLNLEIPFIRLIYSGVGNSNQNYNNNLISLDTATIHYFSTQITLWRKSVLLNLYETANPQSIRDECDNSDALRKFAPNGLVVSSVGKQVGGHYNSVQYPYIATAINHGKWNYTEYETELTELFNEYNINPFERGII